MRLAVLVVAQLALGGGFDGRQIDGPARIGGGEFKRVERDPRVAAGQRDQRVERVRLDGDARFAQSALGVLQRPLQQRADGVVIKRLECVDAAA